MVQPVVSPIMLFPSEIIDPTQSGPPVELPAVDNLFRPRMVFCSERTVIVEFPSRAMAEAWYQSPAYQKVLPLRLNSTTSNVIIVDGVD